MFGRVLGRFDLQHVRSTPGPWQQQPTSKKLNRQQHNDDETKQLIQDERVLDLEGAPVHVGQGGVGGGDDSARERELPQELRLQQQPEARQSLAAASPLRPAAETAQPTIKITQEGHRAHLDHGVLPAATDQVQQEITQDETKPVPYD